MRLPRQVRYAALALVTVGCTSPESAGRETPAWSPGEPELRIGALERLYQVRDATLLTDGRLVILNAGTHEVRVFGPDGAPLVVFGGEGDGPGEFWHPTSVATVGDSLYIFDGRISVWLLPEGTHVRTARLEHRTPGLWPNGWLADGTLVATSSWGGAGPTGPIVVYAYGPDGVLRDTLATYPPLEFFEVDGSSVWSTPHFTPVPVTTAAGRLVYTTDARTRRVNVLDPTGMLTDTVTWEGPPLDVTDEDVATHLATELADSRRDWSGFPASPTFPALDEMQVARDGTLWVRELRRPGEHGHRWLVLRDGELVERVTLPERTELLEAGDGYVVLRERDELDVESVAVYAR